MQYNFHNIFDWSENLHGRSNTTHSKHVIRIISWTCVGGYKIHVEGAQLWHRYLKLQSFPKKKPSNGLKIRDLIW